MRGVCAHVWILEHAHAEESKAHAADEGVEEACEGDGARDDNGEVVCPYRRRQGLGHVDELELGAEGEREDG